MTTGDIEGAIMQVMIEEYPILENNEEYNEVLYSVDIRNKFIDNEIARCDAAIQGFKEKGSVLNHISVMLYERRKRYINDSQDLYDIIEKGIREDEYKNTTDGFYDLFEKMTFYEMHALYNKDIMEITKEIISNIKESKIEFTADKFEELFNKAKNIFLETCDIEEAIITVIAEEWPFLK